MTSELKNNVIENKKERSPVFKLKKCCKKDFLTILKQKITLNRFWSTSKPYFSYKHVKGGADILLIKSKDVNPLMHNVPKWSGAL